jgi:hypothetical protein
MRVGRPFPWPRPEAAYQKVSPSPSAVPSNASSLVRKDDRVGSGQAPEGPVRVLADERVLVFR